MAFRDAVGSYGTAQGLFARAATTPPGPPPPNDPRNEIRAVLEAYRQALERKDIAAYQQLRPNLSETELRRLRASFEEMKSLAVELKIHAIQVNGDEAEAKGHRIDVSVPKRGREVRNEASFIFRLKRSPSGWVIWGGN